MAGLYIHIPFCNSKCAYCGFYSLPSLKLKERFLEALKTEIVARKGYLHGETVNTVYFGGGTPSLLSIKEISELLHLINKTFPVGIGPEITLEANPDTLSLEYLKGLRQLGVNRLSIGIQSFFDNDLKYLSRRHDSQHAQQCLDWAKQAGFSNISIDLIYGLPTSDAEQWNRNLDLFFEMGLPHLSAYALTLEPNSILTKQIELGKVPPVNEEDALRDYEILCQRATENGYLHYEISNFCRRGMHSKHNASYWFGTPYAGFGPSAHSFDGASRQWNVSSVEKYCARVPEPVEGPDIEKESLSPEQLYDEYVMLRLRTHWGIDLKYMKREMGERFSTYCEKQAQPLIAQGRLSQTREFLYLTDAQMLFADGVAEELFWDN
jgi:oxygen-independent coproporphyrinogen-3 oxidase